MTELLSGTGDYLAEKSVENKVFVHPLPFNLIPHIDKFQVRRLFLDGIMLRLILQLMDP